jgi:hypothetical protein
MPRRPVPLSLACCLSTTLTLLVLATGPARAQDRRPGLLPPEGEAAFDKAYKQIKEDYGKINKANTDEKASKDDPKHKEAIDKTAQYYVYRLTWTNNTVPGEVDKVMQSFLNEMNTVDSEAMRKGNPVFTEMFLKATAERAREVIQTRMPIAAVNAGRMLERLAKAGSEDAGNACLDAVQNANDFLDPTARAGVQYWALQGLGELLGRWAEDTTPAPPARKALEAKYVEALANFIEQFVTKDGAAAPVGAAPDEVHGLQVFRRQAVRALGQYRSPAVADTKGAIKTKSALSLVKVVADDGLFPPARLDERIDAAVAVARLQSKALPAYQADYAAQQIGFVVAQMGAEAKPGERKPGSGSKYPWKVLAARLGDALRAMEADTKGAPDKAGEYVQNVVLRSLRVLDDIELKEQSTNGNALNLWLTTNAPPHNSLYKGVADATVRPPDQREPPPAKPAKPETKPEKPQAKPGETKPEPKKPAKP